MYTSYGCYYKNKIPLWLKVIFSTEGFYVYELVIYAV